MTIKQLPHTADIMFEIKAKTLNKLFLDSAQALIKTLAETKTVKPKIKKTITIEGNNDEELLFNMLEEIIFIKDAEAMVFNKIGNLKINNKLKLTLIGDKINIENQKLGNDVKAVTKHKFKLEKSKGRFKTTLIFDI